MTQKVAIRFNVQGGPAVPGCQSVALLSANIQRETTPVHLPSFVPSFGHECFTTLVVSCIYMYIYTQTNTQYKYTCYMLYIFFTHRMTSTNRPGKTSMRTRAHCGLSVSCCMRMSRHFPVDARSCQQQMSGAANSNNSHGTKSNVQALNMYIGLHSTQSSGTLLKWSETICTLFHYVPLVWVKIL